MSFKIDQIQLFSAIGHEIDRQAKEQGIENLAVKAYQLNAMIAGANETIRGFERVEILAPPGSGPSAWMHSDDTGISSRAICYRMFGLGQNEKDTPRDADDFGRCHRFFIACPEYRVRIGDMADVSPQWARLAAAWDELEAHYLEELPSGKFPKFQTRLDALLK